jgi:hypothetical protein
MSLPHCQADEHDVFRHKTEKKWVANPGKFGGITKMATDTGVEMPVGRFRQLIRSDRNWPIFLQRLYD